MGGAPCWVVINCGVLSKAAGTLAGSKRSAPELVDAASYLAGVEDEICELGDKIEPYLTAAEIAEVLQAGDAADELRGEIFGRLFGPVHFDWAPLTPERLVSFAEAQRQFFRSLADKHKRE